ncbi:hypothetical protein IHE45_06G076300 [Dioscorea alata]|uniref:Uncharacterized protein n=1 Tax=Dioscorea alata TaxID=55571 RepID=A0ACB7VYP7_DIOAL|nr:hypothetical protein IHE45_06G076300 [Dioscorea alata]
MAQALLHPLISPPNLKLFSSCKSRSQSPVVSIRKLQSLVLQASKDDMEVRNSDVLSSSNPLLSLINAPSWATWLTTASVVLSIPFYRRIRKAQDQVEVMVDKVADEMENVAEKVEKISADMAEALPEGSLKEMVLNVEKTAVAVEEGAKKTHILIEELDKIEAEVDELVDPLAKGEAV